jgi:hypothetical protein
MARLNDFNVYLDTVPPGSDENFVEKVLSKAQVIPLDLRTDISEVRRPRSMIRRFAPMAAGIAAIAVSAGLMLHFLAPESPVELPAASDSSESSENSAASSSPAATAPPNASDFSEQTACELTALPCSDTSSATDAPRNPNEPHAPADPNTPQGSDAPYTPAPPQIAPPLRIVSTIPGWRIEIDANAGEIRYFTEVDLHEFSVDWDILGGRVTSNENPTFTPKALEYMSGSIVFNPETGQLLGATVLNDRIPAGTFLFRQEIEFSDDLERLRFSDRNPNPTPPTPPGAVRLCRLGLPLLQGELQYFSPFWLAGDHEVHNLDDAWRVAATWYKDSTGWINVTVEFVGSGYITEKVWHAGDAEIDVYYYAFRVSKTNAETGRVRMERMYVARWSRDISSQCTVCKAYFSDTPRWHNYCRNGAAHCWDNAYDWFMTVSSRVPVCRTNPDYYWCHVTGNRRHISEYDH